MTAISELAGDRIELNPDVPFPPFPLWMRLPATWSRLDTNPGTWQRSADELIDTTFRGSRLPSSERRSIVAVLEGLVADCQRAGAALSLITVGRRAAGGAASFGLHLAFASDGRPASLGRAHDVLPRTGVATEISTGCGPAVMHRDRMTMVVPGTAEIAALTTVQAFVPIPDTSWTVVLSTASAYPELTEALESLLRSAAESLRLGSPSDEAGTEVPPDAGSGPDARADPGAGPRPDARADPGTQAEPGALEPGPPGPGRFGSLVFRRMEAADLGDGPRQP